MHLERIAIRGRLMRIRDSHLRQHSAVATREAGVRMTDRFDLGSRVESAQELAPRMRVIYVCDAGHSFAVPFAADAEPPTTWTCRCGDEALRPGFAKPEEKQIRVGRTHLEILHERRSQAFLEKLLAEELRALREGRDSTPRAS